jgi:DNA-binding MarR family transcriptional regulator
MISKENCTKDVLRAFYGVVAVYTSEWKDHNFSLNEALVMGLISRHPGIIAQNISESIAFDPGQLSRLLSKLESRGIIKRNEAKKPPFEKTLYLTPKGEEASAHFEESFDQDIEKHLSILSQKEKDDFLKAMKTLKPLFDILVPEMKPMRTEEKKGQRT